MTKTEILPIPDRPRRRVLERHWMCLIPLASFLIWQGMADHFYSVQVWDSVTGSFDESLVHPLVLWMRGSELPFFLISICAFLAHVFYLRSDAEGWTTALVKLLALPPFALLCLFRAWSPK